MSTAHNDIDTAATRFEWERVVRRIVMPKAVKFLALVLATYADGDGTRVRPGVDALIEDTESSDATVRRQLKQLRDKYGLIEQTRRGGGRGGKGKTNDYRLVIPPDLLDRCEVRAPGERRRVHLTAVRTAAPGPVDNPQSSVTQVTGQSGPSPVDNAAITGHQGDRSIVNDNDFHRSNEAEKRRLTGHLDDRLPTTYQDQPVSPDPARPQHARDGPPIEPPSRTPARASPSASRRRRGKAGHRTHRRGRSP